jgi:quinol monooxygenase YgiN
MPYAVVARYVCSPADIDEIRSALLTMREHTLAEPANLAYVVHEETPGTFLLYEQYTDRAGFDAHTQTPHFTEHILGTVRPRLLARTVHFAEVI